MACHYDDDDDDNGEDDDNDNDNGDDDDDDADADDVCRRPLCQAGAALLPPRTPTSPTPSS
jgi:hypothetical protein